MEQTFYNGEKTGNNILKINLIGEMVRNAKGKKESNRVNVMGWQAQESRAGRVSLTPLEQRPKAFPDL